MSEMANLEARARYQDLSLFRLPAGFRGRSAWFVQLWWIVQATLFGWSPQALYGWRRWLLRRFGAEVGRGALIRPTARITYPWKVAIGEYSWIGDGVVLYSLGKIHVGAHSVISQRSYICAGTHHIERAGFDIMALPVWIGDQCWIASDVFVAAGVSVGDGAVVGARSTVFHDVPEGMVCYGNPTKPMHRRLRPTTDSQSWESQSLGADARSA
jgi:putative colanic acid biosynthesis acetyltransferase WcaF